MRDVVVVPCRQQHRRRGRAPRHHEARVVRELQLVLHVVDARVDHEADEREDEAERDERRAQAGQVGAEREDEQHHCARDIWRDGVQVRLHGGVLEALDDLRHEERHGLDGHAEADLDQEEDVRRGLFENLDCFAEVKILVDDGGGVDLDAVEG